MKNKIRGATTKLERHVQAWLNKQARDYESGACEVLNDLFTGGCASGYVGHLIYYSDTEKFFKAHYKEISGLLAALLVDTGLTPQQLFVDWCEDDPLAHDYQNRNTLAWFAFEETARLLASRNGIVI